MAVQVLDIWFGLASDTALLSIRVLRAGMRVVEPVPRLTAKIPWFGPRSAPETQLSGFAARGHARRLAAEDAVTELVLAVVPRVTRAVLDQIDLNDLITQRVDFDAIIAAIDVNKVAQSLDLNAVAAQLDINAVASRLDIEAVLGRVDLAGVARDVIDAIDLPEIVRDSTGALASETVRSVRFRTVEADELVGRTVAKLLRRRNEGDGHHG